MEDVLGNVLKVGVHKLERDFRGGCINSGSVYGTDDHRLIFVKENRKPGVNSYTHLHLFVIY